jgi:aminopeptidase N
VTDTLLAHLHSTSYRQLLADAAVDALRERGDPAVLDVLLNVLRQREDEFTTGGFASGLTTLALLAAQENNRTPYREFLVAQVNHPKRGVQLAALRALGTLGDPRAIPVLATFADGSQDSPRRKAAEEAIRRLREGRPQAAEVGALRNEVMELQKRHEDLRQQLETAVKQLEAASAEASGN